MSVSGPRLAPEPNQCCSLHSLQECDALCEEGPGAVLQAPDHGPLHLLQPEPVAGGEPSPAQRCQ